MELSPRLRKIAELIPVGSRIADVGTDHAYIPIYCFEKNIIRSAIAMDVNPMPLKRAEINIDKYGFGKKSELRLSNGIEKLFPDEVDVIVIAGMGGLLIRDIIDSGSGKITGKTELIVQPMIAPVELRRYLFDNGFDITNEYVVREENKFYNIFSVQRGSADVNEENIYIGKNLKANSPDVYADYLSYKIRVTQNILNGMEKSENPDEELLAKYRRELKIYKSFSEE